MPLHSNTAVKAARLTTSPAIAQTATAIHLPATRCSEGTGLSSNGTSEPRSRSPAVASSARNIPPVKAETSANTDIMLSNRGAPPFAAAGD
jgi:hypothetical protein